MKYALLTPFLFLSMCASWNVAMPIDYKSNTPPIPTVGVSGTF